MNKTTETIEGLMKIPVSHKDYEIIRETIKILQAVESAEGELPEKKRKVSQYTLLSGRRMGKNTYIRADGFNQAIDIARPILAKAKLENKELRERIEELEKYQAKLIDDLNEATKPHEDRLDKIYDEWKKENDELKLELQSFKEKLTKGNIETQISNVLGRYVPDFDYQIVKDILQALIKELGGEG